MLKAIIEFSLRNRALVLLATAALTLGGIFALRNLPLDAIPDLSDTQVIIYTEWPGQAPQIVQDQVTYPITTKMLSVPNARVVRGYSFYGFSFVYIIFEDGTDPYWARSRVLEYLSSLGRQLPAGRDALARSGCHRCRLGIHLHDRLKGTQPRGVALDAGLVPQIPTHGRGRRGRGRKHRWLRQAIPSHGRSDEAPGLRPFDF